MKQFSMKPLGRTFVTLRNAVTQSFNISSKVLLTLPFLGLSGTVLANEDPVIEDIVVTATKTGARSLQDTPMAISAFSEEAMENSGIQSVRDIGLLTPGITITANEQFAQPFIRGVGTTTFSAGNETPTAIHLDGVYLGRPVMLFTDFVDMERIEVLRGPNGTLYGRNATAGAINMITQKPTEEFSGKTSLEVGNFNKVRAKASFSGPITETVAGNISLLYSDDDGFVDNLRSQRPGAPSKIGDEAINGGMGSLVFTPNDDLQIKFSADYAEIKGPNSILKPVNDVLAVIFGAQAIPDPWTVDFDVVPEMDHETWGTHVTVDYQLSNGMTFKSITGYRESDYYIFNEEDGFEFDVVDAIVFEYQDQFSQEFQLVSDPEGDFTWVAGFFYYNENTFQNVLVSVFGDDLGDRIDDNETDAYALFFEGTYQFTDQLSGVAGIRQSYEKKSCTGVRDTDVQGAREDSWRATTPKFGVNYQLNDDALLYASATRGFKSGVCRPGQDTVNPEWIWSYELGAKVDWLDGRLRTNAVAFVYDYSDLQVFTFQGSAGAVISSAPTVDIQGLELEIAFAPTDNLMLTSAIAYLDTEYSDFTSTNVLGVDEDVSGNNLPFSPEWTYNVTAQYTAPIDENKELSLYGEYLWTDDIFHTQFNDEITRQDDYGLVNLRASLSLLDSGWEVSAYVRNATNEAYYDTLFQYGFDPEDVLGIIRPPRTYGVQVQYSF